MIAERKGGSSGLIEHINKLDFIVQVCGVQRI